MLGLESNMLTSTSETALINPETVECPSHVQWTPSAEANIKVTIYANARAAHLSTVVGWDAAHVVVHRRDDGDRLLRAARGRGERQLV